MPIPTKNNATEDTVTSSGSINKARERSVISPDVYTIVQRLSFFVRTPDKNRRAVIPPSSVKLKEPFALFRLRKGAHIIIEAVEKFTEMWYNFIQLRTTKFEFYDM